MLGEPNVQSKTPRQASSIQCKASLDAVQDGEREVGEGFTHAPESDGRYIEKRRGIEATQIRISRLELIRVSDHAKFKEQQNSDS